MEVFDSFNLPSLAPYAKSGRLGKESSIMKYDPANSTWHWLALIGMGLEWPSAGDKTEVDGGSPSSAGYRGNRTGQ